MSALAKILSVGGMVGAFSLVGWALMKLMTPSREDMIKELPEKDPKRMAASRKRSQEFLDAIKASAETNRPIYRDGIGVLRESLKKD